MQFSMIGKYPIMLANLADVSLTLLAYHFVIWGIFVKRNLKSLTFTLLHSSDEISFVSWFS